MTPLKIALISRSLEVPSSARLAAACEAAGHELLLLPTLSGLGRACVPADYGCWLAALKPAGEWPAVRANLEWQLARPRG